jgi:hypothetical protein
MQTVGLDTIITAAACACLAAVLIWAGYEVREHARRALYRARHSAMVPGPGLAVPGYDDLGSLCLADEQAWLTGLGGSARWQSDLDDGELPWWAAPEADRVGAYGPNSGSAGRGDFGDPPWEPAPRPGPSQLDPEFDTPSCTCYHLESDHDDGGGCTVEGCLCVAGWSWDDRTLAGLASAPTCLDGTAFDRELAAQVAEWSRQQDRDAADFTARMWAVIGHQPEEGTQS